MVEISFPLPTPNASGWVRGIFTGIIPQRAEAIQPLGTVKPAITGITPVFSLRFGESPVEEQRLTKDTEAYSMAKYAFDPTDQVGHAQLMATYEALRKRHAASLPRGVAITVFGRSLFVSTSKRPVSERVDEQYISPFHPRTSVIPSPSPALGD